MSADAVVTPRRRALRPKLRRLLPWTPWLLFASWGLLSLFVRWSDPARPDHFEGALSGAEDLRPVADPYGTERLEGTVVGAGGGTIEDALVFVRGETSSSWDRTDRAGHFELERLHAPPWRVIVVGRGHEPRSFDVADRSGGATTFALDVAIEEPPDFPARESSPLVGRIQSTLLPAGAGGFEVYLRPISPLDELGTAFPRRALTAADGTFRVDGLDHGRYEVLVLPPWAVGGTWPDVVAATEFSGLVHPLAEGTLVVPLAMGSVSGRLVDERGTFLEGALVMIEAALDPSRVWPPITSDADGAFRFDALPPGSYVLRARAGAGATEQRIDVRRDTVLHLDLDPLAPAGQAAGHTAEDDR